VKEVPADGLVMDSAQHCLDQSAKCRRLMKLAQSEDEIHTLKILARSWVGLAGRIDRYNALVREQSRGVVGQK
jgi:hypothetical protein